MKCPICKIDLNMSDRQVIEIHDHLVALHDPVPRQLVGRERREDQLPTVRQLAVDLRVNANTVARVYGDLERAGVIGTRRGVGSFVTASPALARPARAHERRLRALATRVLAAAAAPGFTLDDLLTALEAQREGGA